MTREITMVVALAGMLFSAATGATAFAVVFSAFYIGSLMGPRR